MSFIPRFYNASIIIILQIKFKKFPSHETFSTRFVYMMYGQSYESFTQNWIEINIKLKL
jgi:hypothetical protein